MGRGLPNPYLPLDRPSWGFSEVSGLLGECEQ
jgi:hypothetical protein